MGKFDEINPDIDDEPAEERDAGLSTIESWVNDSEQFVVPDSDGDNDGYNKGAAPRAE